MLRPAPAGALTITTKLNHKGTAQYQQGGIIVYGDDDNYIKLDRTSTNTAAATTKTEFVEFVQEVAATARNATADHTANLPAAQDPNMWLRIVYNGTNLIGQYSPDGTHLDAAPARPRRRCRRTPKIGFFALSNAATTTVDAVFDWWQVEGTNAPAIPGCTHGPEHQPGDQLRDAHAERRRHHRHGDQLRRGRHRRRRRHAHLRVGLRRHDDVRAAEPDEDLHHAGHLHGQGHGVRRQGRHRHPDAQRGRHAGQPRPDGDRRADARRAPSPPGTSIAFTATGTDADGDTLTYSWDFGDSTPASTQQNPSHTYANAGTYAAKVTVSDGKGGTGDGHGQRGRRRAPTPTRRSPRRARPRATPRVGVPVAFTATGTDPDGDPLTYSWNFGDSTSSTEQNPTHAFPTAATFSVVVTVSDGKGGTGTATLSVVVQANRNPTISPPRPPAATASRRSRRTFAATATDPDGHAVTYAWDLDGDGTFETTGQNPRSPTPRPASTRRCCGSPTRSAARPRARSTRQRVRRAAGPERPLQRARLLQDGRVPALGDPGRARGDPEARAPRTTSPSTRPRTRRCSPTRSSSRYDLVVFNSTTGDVLNDTQQAAFERFIRAGNGYAGIHSATDTEYGWPWYGQLTGAYFRNHPNGTPTATVVVEDPTKPSTQGLPARWTRVDEWYNFQGIVNPVVNGGGTDVSPRGKRRSTCC